MELRQLRYFVVLAEELHFGRAAEVLRIARPTLSQQLGALERSLGQRLFERSSHGVTLTAPGRALLDHAPALLAEADRARRVVQAVGQQQREVDMRIATGLERLFGPLLHHLQDRHPVNFTKTNSLDAEAAVLAGRADVALVWPRASRDDRVLQQTLTEPEVYLALPGDHPLAAFDPVPVAALAEERFALFPRRLAPGAYDLFVEHLLAPGGDVAARALALPTRLSPMEGMIEAVVRGGAVAPFCPAIAEGSVDMLAAGVALRPLEPTLRVPIQILWPRHPSPVVLGLLDDIDAWYRVPQPA